MARPGRRYDIYLPLTFNNGQEIPNEQFVAIERRLIVHFGGATSMRRDWPLRGAWQSGVQLFIDHVVVMTALDFRPRGSTRFIAELKRDLLRDFDQLETLITKSALRVH